MKIVIAFFTCILCSTALSQDRFGTATGVLQIDASTPLEDIRAKNDNVSAVLDPNTGEMAVLLLNKELVFRNRLMGEHFNENYMESDKFPKSSFTGKLKGFLVDKLGTQSKKFHLIGELNVHGVTRLLDTWVLVTKNAEEVIISFSFIVKTEDHKIKVPKLLFKKIAKEVSVEGKLALRPVEK